MQKKCIWLHSTELETTATTSYDYFKLRPPFIMIGFPTF